MIDTGDRLARVWDVATLIGEGDGGKDRITLEEFSAWSGELQRAVLTSLGPRLPRVYD
jgi:alanine racemase